MTNYQKDFNKLLCEADHRQNFRDTFREFCTRAAYSLACVYYPEEAREAFERTKMSDDKLKVFEQAFEVMIQAMQQEEQDFLGAAYMANELGNDRAGQFFTPYHLCLLSARLSFGDCAKQIRQKGIIRVTEPTCGSGGMIIAARQVLIEEGYTPSTQMYVEMTDLDELCFLMSYIQVSLYGIAAKVIHGNTLSMENYNAMYTPIYFVNNFAFHLAALDLLQHVTAVPARAEAEAALDEVEGRIERGIKQTINQREPEQYRLAL